MVSQAIGSSPAPSLRNQPAKIGCSWVSTNYVAKYKIRKVCVVRDFPIGCGSSSQYTTSGQNERLASQVLDCAERPNLGDVSGSNDSAVSFGEKVFGFKVSLEGKGSENPNDSSENEPTEISKEGENQMIPRVYPPRRKISAIRCFPVGCRQEIHRFSNVQANGNETSGSNDMVSIAKHEVLKDEVLKDEVLTDEVLTDEVLKEEVKRPYTSNCGSSEVALEEIDQDIKCLNNVTKKKGSKLKRFRNQQQLLSSGSRNQLPLTKQVDIEIPEQRLTVQGLMASSRCPFRTKERRSQRNIKRK